MSSAKMTGVTFSVSKRARAIAVALGAVIAFSTVAPASAGPIPVTPSRSMDSPLALESVQYRGKRAPVRVKRRGNNGAAAAALIGAVAIGAAAIAASNAEKRRQRRIERQYYYGAGYPPGYGYAQPAPQYYAPPQPQYYGGYYQQPVPQAQPRYRRNVQRLDPSSPYAVQQYRGQRGYYGRRYAPQEEYRAEPYNTPF